MVITAVENITSRLMSGLPFHLTDFHQREQTGVPVTRLYPDVPASILFSDINGVLDSHLKYDRGEIVDGHMLGYYINANRMIKLALLFAQLNGIEIGLRGSCNDNYLIAQAGGGQRSLSYVKEHLNSYKRVIPGTDYIGPFQHPYDPINPLNPDIRLLVTNNDSDLLNRLKEMLLEKILTPIDSLPAVNRRGSIYHREKAYRKAFNFSPPETRRTLKLSDHADSAIMPILIYSISKQFLGAPPTKSMILSGSYTMAELREMARLQAEDYVKCSTDLGFISFTCNSAGDKRKPERAFNVDSLVSRLILSENIDLNDPLLVEKLDHAIVLFHFPEIPTVVTISSEALIFYEEGIIRGKPNYHIDWFETVIRGLRKALTLGVHKYDAATVEETKRLSKIAAASWNDIAHDPKMLNKVMRDLHVCHLIDNDVTLQMLHELGLWDIVKQSITQYYADELDDFPAKLIENALRFSTLQSRSWQGFGVCPDLSRGQPLNNSPIIVR
ncbi:MAG: hypothetical protein US11_C0003G0007 [Candidatus Roizmanbacteria bacterium GW2011_GWA2_36_23]|uniref:Uncharacterized protein n=1 Tax=Candidatus Roizmanbacteria bacterium GW2011_GWA2_36_23 TaxID=1618480 RepID=A0A0G0GPX7_9BACT|nr:MAG: hypothetical protein US11_C0003G0007 [Candidatus Roizmanbacteria bacterium GW2011_GWA2_36_23]